MQDNEILRYNQGFGGFGLMEQCTDGKWVLAEDFDYLQHRLTVLKTDLHETDERANILRKDNIELRHTAASRVRRLSIDLKYSRKMNRALISLILFGGLIRIVTLTLWN